MKKCQSRYGYASNRIKEKTDLDYCYYTILERLFLFDRFFLTEEIFIFNLLETNKNRK